MKLTAPDVAFTNSSTDTNAVVVGISQTMGIIGGNRCIGMHKVHSSALRHPRQWRLSPVQTCSRSLQLTPANVGNTMHTTGWRHLWHLLHAAGNQTQPRVFTVLFPKLKQHLRAYTNTQKGPLSGSKALDQVIKTTVAHLPHATNESADTRQHQAVRQLTDLRGLRNDRHVRPATLQSTHNIQQIAYAVVDDGNCGSNQSRTSSPDARASAFSTHTEVRFQCNASAMASPEAPSFTARARSDGRPYPPLAMIGTWIRAATARTRSTSKPLRVPSWSIEVSMISPAPSATARSTHSTTSNPVCSRPLSVNASHPRPSALRLASTESTMHCAPKRWDTSVINSGRATAAVLIATLSAPERSMVCTSFNERIPPPTVIGTNT